MYKHIFNYRINNRTSEDYCSDTFRRIRKGGFAPHPINIDKS